MKGNPCYVSATPLSIQSSYDVSAFDIHLNGILCRTAVTQSMKHKIGINPFILPTLLNQRIILLIHQPDGFVYKLICTHIFIEYAFYFYL